MSLLAYVYDERQGDVVVAVVEGEVDASNAGDVGGRLRGMVTNRDRRLVLDLSATRYLDSAGIKLLFDLGAELGERQQRLQLVVAPSSPIARMLSITGLDTAVATYATREQALQQPDA